MVSVWHIMSAYVQVHVCVCVGCVVFTITLFLTCEILIHVLYHAENI